MSEIEAPEIGITEIDTLLRYLPAFTDPGFRPGNWVVEDGHFPYFQPSPLVDEFVQTIVHEQIIIQFDWSSWIEEAQR
jgi:Family of unknown function (DUF6508)